MSDLEEEIAAEMGEDDELEPGEAAEGPVEGDADTGADATADGPPAPRSQKEIDALTEKLQREAERHAKRVEEIMGEDFALLVPSPVDWTPGYIFNVPQMHPAPEQVAELHALLGHAAPVELKEATDAEACPDCSALGEVLTGSRKPGQETKPCSACNGTGWKVKLAMPIPAPAPVTYSNGAATTPGTPNQFQVADRWGRPFGHPHYNLEPAQVGA